MGLTGEFVLFRGEQPAEELFKLFGKRTRAEIVDFRAGGWQQVLGEFVPADKLPVLAETTGAPVLLAEVHDSDSAHLVGYSDLGTWEAWFDVAHAPTLMAASRWNERVTREFEALGIPPVADPTVFVALGYTERPAGWPDYLKQTTAEAVLEHPHIAAAAERWAADAGFTVPAGPIEALLGEKNDPFVDDLVYELFDLLGLPPVEGERRIVPEPEPGDDSRPLGYQAWCARTGRKELNRDNWRAHMQYRYTGTPLPE